MYAQEILPCSCILLVLRYALGDRILLRSCIGAASVDTQDCSGGTGLRSAAVREAAAIFVFCMCCGFLRSADSVWSLFCQRLSDGICVLWDSLRFWRCGVADLRAASAWKLSVNPGAVSVLALLPVRKREVSFRRCCLRSCAFRNCIRGLLRHFAVFGVFDKLSERVMGKLIHVGFDSSL